MSILQLLYFQSYRLSMLFNSDMLSSCMDTADNYQLFKR